MVNYCEERNSRFGSFLFSPRDNRARTFSQGAIGSRDQEGCVFVVVCGVEVDTSGDRQKFRVVCRQVTSVQ